MNKKFLTALLLGAFTIASTSTLVSCKDYDDDINGLQEQIDQKTTEINNLQAALTKAETDLKAEIATLKQQLTEEETRAKAAEQALINDLNTEAGRAKAAEQKLTDDLADAVARIANLEARMQTAEDALKEVQQAIKDEEQARKDADAALETKLNTEVASINAKLTALGDDLAAAQKTLQDAIDAEKVRALAAEAALQDDIDAKAQALQTLIDAEKTAREAAIAQLTQQVAALETFRTAIDARVKAIEDDYLTSADKDELKALITAEENARIAAVAALQAELEGQIASLEEKLRALVAAEKQALENKITDLETALRQAIADEETARKAADADEADARAAADATEKAERVAAIKDLTGKLEAAVISLQNQINTLTTKLNTEVTRLEGLIQDAKDAADAAKDAADKAKDAAKDAQDAADDAQRDATKALGQIADEIKRAEDIENDLRADLNTEIAARAGAIAQEVLDRNDAIATAIATAIANEVDERNTAIGTAKNEAQSYAERLVDAEETARNTAIQELQNDVITPLSQEVAKISTNLSTLEALIFESLRSLVLEPASYYHGIQAIDVTTLSFKALTLGAVTADGEYKDDAATEGDDIVVAPEIVANYHMNPTTAVVSDDVAKYQFLPLDRKYTKANSETALEVTSVNTDAGMLTVKAKIEDASKIKNIAADEHVTVIALNYADTKTKTDGTDEDYNVTSDYAALKASYISNFRLNYALGAGHPHLYVRMTEEGTVKGAINEVAMHSIAWNSDPIDLRELVNTHVAYQNGSSDVAIDDSQLKEMGLTYHFELIGYGIPADNTPTESAWGAIKQTDDGKYLFRPQPVGTDNKQQEYDEELEQTKLEIGHQPIVRVTLNDATSGKIVAVGYLKIRITTAAKLTIPFEATDKYTLVCLDATPVLNYAGATLDDIEHEVIDEINIPIGMFIDATDGYALELDGTEAKQYTKEDGTVATADEKFGTVTETGEHNLVWTVTNKEAYDVFKANTSKTIFVRYVAVAGGVSADRMEEVYVKFTWTPSEINITPTAVVSNGDKLDPYWYAKGTNTNTGFDDIHGNVQVYNGTYSNPLPFTFNLKSAFEGNKIPVTIDEGYDDIKANTTAHFEFVEPEEIEVFGESGATYVLSIDGAGAELWATNKADDTKKAQIADLNTDPTTGGLVQYLSNDIAKDVLNYAGHKQLGAKQTLTAKVAIKTKSCNPFQSIGGFDPTNNTFDVKFLRPITIENGTAEFVDATSSGSTVDVKMTFIDWRDFEFIAHSGEFNYFKYYGVTNITADLDNATTDLRKNADGTWKNLAVVSGDLRNAFSWTAPTPDGEGYVQANNYGKLTYKNIGLTVGEFKVAIPITITYAWGEIKSTVTATVKKTINNVKKQ